MATATTTKTAVASSDGGHAHGPVGPYDAAIQRVRVRVQALLGLWPNNVGIGIALEAGQTEDWCVAWYLQRYTKETANVGFAHARDGYALAAFIRNMRVKQITAEKLQPELLDQIEDLEAEIVRLNGLLGAKAVPATEEQTEPLDVFNEPADLAAWPAEKERPAASTVDAAIVNATYFAKWQGTRVHPSEWAARRAEVTRIQQGSYNPDEYRGISLRFGCYLVLAGITTLEATRRTQLGGSVAPSDFAGQTLEEYLENQFATAKSGGKPSTT
jgi:hypothetical protein